MNFNNSPTIMVGDIAARFENVYVITGNPHILHT